MPELAAPHGVQHNVKEIVTPKIKVTGLGNYKRNVRHITGSITYEFEAKMFNNDHGIKSLAGVMNVEEADAFT